VSLSQVSVVTGRAHAMQSRAASWLSRMSPTSWELWARPTHAVGYILLIDVLAVVTVVAQLFVLPVEPAMLVPFVILIGCSVGYIEASLPIERIREHSSNPPHIDLNSVWMFAAVLLLPPVLAAAVISTSYTYRWVRVRRHIVHRQVFSTAATIIAGLFAVLLVRTLTPGASFADAPRDWQLLGTVVLAGAIFLIVNTLLIAGAIATTTDNPRVRTLFGSAGDYALEMATIALGVLLAWALADWPVAMALIVGITLVLHRNVLIRQLREKAKTDSKTGLLNASAWNSMVDSELDRAARHDQPSGLLVIALDHFKAFHDEFGHLAGDEMLRAVACTIAGEVRAYDLLGRFGGEEFVVLLPATSATETMHVAERIRRRIAELTVPIAAHRAPVLFGRLTVSIGVAAYPDHGVTRSDVLYAADMAMYCAKAAGRNQVFQASDNHVRR
jgi:diguanylate cyclase (GGDEF)-like protein